MPTAVFVALAIFLVALSLGSGFLSLRPRPAEVSLIEVHGYGTLLDEQCSLLGCVLVGRVDTFPVTLEYDQDMPGYVPLRLAFNTHEEVDLLVVPPSGSGRRSAIWAATANGQTLVTYQERADSEGPFRLTAGAVAGVSALVAAAVAVGVYRRRQRSTVATVAVEASVPALSSADG